MYCRSRPQYRSDLGWTLGVTFLGTLTRSARPAQGFTYVRCCSAPPASSPHGLMAPGRIVSRRPTCVQLPSACGCFQLAPQRTCTSNPGSMPGTPRVLAALASPPATEALDPELFSRHSLRQAVYAILLQFGVETAGGLIQVAIGFAGGSGCFLTKRSGFLLKAPSRVFWRAAWIASV